MGNASRLVQRLGCSVNAAFLLRDATARDRNAAFRLQNGQRIRTGATPRLQRERCVPIPMTKPIGRATGTRPSGCLALSIEHDDSAAERGGGGLGPIAHVQFGKDAVHVILDGAFGHGKRGSYLFVAAALDD